MKTQETRQNGTTRVFTINEEPDLAMQEFKDDCDVNLILAKFMKTGAFTHTRGPGQYWDSSEIPDFMGAMNQVVMAQNAFMELPAQLRARFGNSPQALIDFLQNPDNLEESIRLGLRERKEAPQQPQPTAPAGEGVGAPTPASPAQPQA